MNYFAPFKSVKNKLDELLAGYMLVATWRELDYPLKLVISPDASPEAQMSLLGDEEGSISPNARLCYTFSLDDINVELDGRLAVPESLMSKIMGYAKKMHHLWLEGFFAAVKNGDYEDLESLDDGDSGEPDEAYTSGENNDFDEFYSDEPGSPEPDGQ